MRAPGGSDGRSGSARLVGGSLETAAMAARGGGGGSAETGEWGVEPSGGEEECV